MAGVGFAAHRLELLASYQDVIGEDSPTDWALYTYEDGSDDLKLAASGGGGLLELSGHFEIQKVMYGFCSVKDPQAVLPKYVLVNWVGEDVPDARKCACASHVAKIAEFFQGVDVIVNASSVEDIDPGAIGQRLSNGLARVSSPVLHRLRLREDENAEPVGTTYQKTDATVEMKRLNREQFWEQAKKEEELRKEEERKKALDARLRFEQERMEQERLEQEERERRYREREEQIEEHRRKQQSMEAEEARQRLKEQSIFVDQQDEDDRQQLRKSESEVEEAAAIIAQRPDNPRDFFKQQERVASGSSDAISPGSHRTDSPSPSTQEARPATPEQHWPFLGPEDKATEPPGDEPSPRPVWTAGDEALGDLVTLEPTEPSLPPVAAEPQPGGTPNPESLIDLWQSDEASPPAAWPLPAAPVPEGPPATLPDEGALLSLDELPEPPATFCDAEQEEEPVGEGDSQPQGLDCQRAPQEDTPGRETPPITNGEMAPKDGTPGRGEQASEGYFSQSQEEEVPPPEELSAKAPQPIFYNKPPEIDITCWDADPLPDEEESFGGAL
ncbi:drebrin isoform X3 [Falco rusticolus]|uniref:drebrin isoform X3 n=1 Tax=Falco rusticolus TaxID=120794 RepID=UPI001886681F|nr:drebrin isoform X3 [Falco rusticolus]XP_055575341.1 drebrin isoform X3 [Falco cherrug]XP_055669023.1 drebrin isoform X3 [Falco peregrinus]